MAQKPIRQILGQDGPSVVDRLRDQLGRPLQTGDEVLVPSLVSPRYRVADIAPALDPQAPPGAVRVLIVCQVLLVMDGRQPVQQLLRVRTNAEVNAAGAAPPAAALPTDGGGGRDA